MSEGKLSICGGQSLLPDCGPRGERGAWKRGWGGPACFPSVSRLPGLPETSLFLCSLPELRGQDKGKGVLGFGPRQKNFEKPFVGVSELAVSPFLGMLDIGNLLLSTLKFAV